MASSAADLPSERTDATRAVCGEFVLFDAIAATSHTIGYDSSRRMSEEGAIKLQGTGKLVLERCDGQRTFGDIITELQKEFGQTDPEKIRADIGVFLEQLQKKRIVDY